MLICDESCNYRFFAKSPKHFCSVTLVKRVEVNFANSELGDLKADSEVGLGKVYNVSVFMSYVLPKDGVVRRLVYCLLISMTWSRLLTYRTRPTRPLYLAMSSVEYFCSVFF